MLTLFTLFVNKQSMGFVYTFFRFCLVSIPPVQHQSHFCTGKCFRHEKLPVIGKNNFSSAIYKKKRNENCYNSFIDRKSKRGLFPGNERAGG